MPSASVKSPAFLPDFEEAYQCLNSAVFILEEKTRNIVFANKTAEKLTGRRKQALIKQKFMEIFDPNDGPRVEQILDAGDDIGLFSGYSLKLERKSKRIIFTDIFGKVLKSGSKSWIVFTVHDITALQAANETLENRVAIRTEDLRRVNQNLLSEIEERKRAERMIAEQRLKLFVSAKLTALGEMAGGVAHEINNPLSVVQGCVELIRDEPERASVLLEKIQSSIDRAVKIVTGLKHFARDGENDPLEDMHVDAWVEEVVLLCTERMREHGIDFRVHPVPAGIKLNCRPVQLHQVLLNLISNAHDAVAGAPEKWVSIEVQDRGERVCLSVSDSGRTIPRDIQERMFEPFFTTKGPSRGIGLGLSISKGIVETHGGRIELDPMSVHTRLVVELPKAIP